jgi:hypothetical protein
LQHYPQQQQQQNGNKKSSLIEERKKKEKRVQRIEKRLRIPRQQNRTSSRYSSSHFARTRARTFVGGTAVALVASSSSSTAFFMMDFFFLTRQKALGSKN